MKLSELVKNLNMETIVSGDEEINITEAYTSDLMSDVLANAPDGSILITIQSHKNSVAVASTVDIAAIFICNNRPIPNEAILAAKSENIGIYRSKENQYTLSWRVHENVG